MCDTHARGFNCIETRLSSTLSGCLLGLEAIGKQK